MSSLTRAMTSKLALSALPLPPPAQQLIHRLTPDTHTSSVSSFRTSILPSKPSLQRRARLLSPQSHFSFVNPFPCPFPYDIEAPGPDDPPVTDKAAYIEEWLAAREATRLRPKAEQDRHPNAPLRIYDPDPQLRKQPLVLLGIAETALGDCLPHLDVGDAFALLGAPSLSDEYGDEGDSQPSDNPDVVRVRDELVDILSGQSVLSTPEDVDDAHAFAPWSLRYSGHQFGSWAGQLGDGRAISILSTPHPSTPHQLVELQLKGAGRTPFSRTADGLAVLRSSVREYLCSEAMSALHIPTTRALSLISLPALPVVRERQESACVLTRLAPSFIRIGSFEALNGPANMFFFGGGQQDPHWDGLRILGEWVAQQVLHLELKDGDAWGRELVLEVARRNAKMVAAWQAYGFMHGVINTDNVSILGLTIDYGPYAFMDVYDPLHICNHTDEGGRYAYKYQPNMIIYALRALLASLAPLIGAERALGHSVPSGWAEGKSKDELEAWREEGMRMKEEVEAVCQETAGVEYGRLMRTRLGLRHPDPADETTLVRPLLEMMDNQKLDFHGTFRTLGAFRPAWLHSSSDAKELEMFIATLVRNTPDAPGAPSEAVKGEWRAWLETYAARIGAPEERLLWGGDGDGDEKDVDKARADAMRGVNPRFVLRQWVLEEVIRRVERDAEAGRKVLGKVLQMATNPFEAWGTEGREGGEGEEELRKEEEEERRFCGMGEKRMLGFQCSCSS
ncbi:hypothetical protein H0H87_008761 [Tephrocybe sp. NHM501043]|nr:hypothetical protein H0H87_008761 [Tephrocybe sp. NHM501043]